MRPTLSPQLLNLLVVEAAERAAWFGVLSLLPLHLAGRMSMVASAAHVMGLVGARQALQSVLGPLAPAALASLVFGSFTGCAYVTPLLGAVVADRSRRRRTMILAGLGLSATGCALLATDSGLLVGLALLVVGAGGVKANLLAQVGALEGGEGARRRFVFYLIAVNLGALSGPFACGWIAQAWGWRGGFLAAAAMLATATLAYLSGVGSGFARLRDSAKPPSKAEETRGPFSSRLGDGCEAGGGSRARLDVDRQGGLPLGRLTVLLVPYVLFYTAYNQAFNLLPIWASTHVALALDGFRTPVAWFYTVDGVFTIVAAAVVARLWRRGGGPDGALAVAAACGLAATAFIGLGLVARARPTPLLAMIGFFAVLDAGLPLIEASTLARLNRLAPAGAAATALALTSLAFAVADFGAGAIGALYPTMTPARFWWLQAIVAGLGAAIVLATRRPARAIAMAVA